MEKITKYIVIALVTIILSGISHTYAIESVGLIQNATSKAEKGLNTLLDIKDNPTITGDERDEKGLAARKDIISDAISLSLAEIKNLKASLAKLPEFQEDSNEFAIQSRFLEDLDSYAEYFDLKQDELEKISTVEEAKVFAKEIIDYRSNIYSPSIDRIGEFSLAFYVGDVIDITDARMAKMSADIKKLEKLNLIKIGVANKSLARAEESLNNARGKQSKAFNLIILRNLPEEEPSLGDVSTIKESKPPVVGKEPEPRDLLGSGLADIKTTYDIFIQISKEIRKSLGLR